MLQKREGLTEEKQDYEMEAASLVRYIHSSMHMMIMWDKSARLSMFVDAQNIGKRRRSTNSSPKT